MGGSEVAGASDLMFYSLEGQGVGNGIMGNRKRSYQYAKKEQRTRS